VYEHVERMHEARTAGDEKALRKTITQFEHDLTKQTPRDEDLAWVLQLIDERFAELNGTDDGSA
jgi:hypothetical protein